MGPLLLIVSWVAPLLGEDRGTVRIRVEDTTPTAPSLSGLRISTVEIRITMLFRSVS